MKTFKFELQRFTATTVPANLVQKAWSKDVWESAMKQLYFAKFTGEGPEHVIHKLTQLKKEAGDRITVPLLMKLTGTGVTNDADLEGQEEALNFYDFSVPVTEYAHAVRLKGNMEEQKTAINMRSSAKSALSIWLQEKTDALIFAALTASPTAGRVVYAGANTAENTIVANDKFAAALIGKAKRIAQLSEPKIRPVMVDGKKHWVLIIHPYQARDLKADSAWLDAQKSAGVRGLDNPIFSGMLGVYDDVVVHEHEMISVTATGATGAKVGHALLLGAQAGAMAVAQETAWREKTFNYGKSYGIATDAIFGISKSVFNSVDFATIQVMSSAAVD